MIGKHLKGSDFNRCLNYVLKKEGASIIGGNVVSNDPSSLTREFHFYTQLNPNVTRPLFHGILSSREPLDDFTWHKIGNEYLKLMGFTKNPYVLVHHTDRPHDHIHIVAGRVRTDGSCVSDRFDYYRNKQAVRLLEQKFGLSSPQFNYTQKLPSVNEVSSITYIKSVINELCQQPNLSLLELLHSLANREIRVSFHKTKNEKIRGIRYHYGQDRLTGTQLGETYTWRGLIRKRNLFYRPEQQPLIEQCAIHNTSISPTSNQPRLYDLVNELNELREEINPVVEKKNRTRSR